MTEWSQILLTHGLTAIVTYILTNLQQSRSRKFEAEKEYREEIRKHMDDIIKPLFTHLLRLQRHLTIINEGIIQKRSLMLPQTREIYLKECIEINKNLMDFIGENRATLSLILPSPFPWIFVSLNNLLLGRILDPLLHPDWLEVFDRDLNYEKDMFKVFDIIENIQTDIRRLVGYDIDIKLETKYPS